MSCKAFSSASIDHAPAKIVGIDVGMSGFLFNLSSWYHHAYQSSVRQGFRWWEIDLTYYILRALSWLGIGWDLKTPPHNVLRNEHRLGSRVINRAAEQLATHFSSERIALAITSALHGSELSALQETLIHAHHRTTEVLKNLHLSQVPSREEFLAEAKAMFAKTRSLDGIVDHAYELILASVCTRLAAPIEERSNARPHSVEF